LTTEEEAGGGVDDAIGGHFRKWLRIGTGCGFAASLANAGRVAYEAHAEMPPVHEVDTNLDAYAASRFSAVFIFPFATSEAGLVDVLASLRAGSSRWKIRDRGPGNGGTHLVGVQWSTANGDVSDAMGFAPLPSMPVTRRAPYFAIAAWPGGRENPERGTPPTPRARRGEVSFLDAAHGFGHDAYAALWDLTMTAVAGLMVMPPDSAKRYYTTAFVLSATAASAITFDP